MDINPSCYYTNDKIIYSLYYSGSNIITVNPTIEMY